MKLYKTSCESAFAGWQSLNWPHTHKKTALKRRLFEQPPDKCRVAGPVRCLLEQGQHALLRLVGLGQHGRGGLRDDLRAGQLGGGLGKISVLHPAA